MTDKPYITLASGVNADVKKLENYVIESLKFNRAIMGISNKEAHIVRR